MSDRRQIHARRVFVDSGAFYAVADRRSQYHCRAVEVAGQLADRCGHLFTTNFVVAETHALLISRMGQIIAADVVRRIDEGESSVVRVSAADERRARNIIATLDDKDYTLTDATSFAVMERLRIGEAFAFDSHFAHYGFAVLGPEHV